MFTEHARTASPEVQICYSPVHVGNCSDRVAAWFYDAASQKCQAFVYSGCGGNANRFISEEQCERHCGRFRGLGTSCVLCAHTHITSLSKLSIHDLFCVYQMFATIQKIRDPVKRLFPNGTMTEQPLVVKSSRSVVVTEAVIGLVPLKNVNRFVLNLLNRYRLLEMIQLFLILVSVRIEYSISSSSHIL